jgi:putative FmdB family regulatory protein
MPFYEYECDNCKFYTELLQKISDPPLKKCPSCGKNKMRKLVSAPIFRLKGGGWYETDFKSDKEGKRNLAVDKEPDTVADAKPAAKAESKDSKPAADGKATESKPAESKSGESKSGESKSGESKSGESKSSQSSESRSGESRSEGSGSRGRGRSAPPAKSKAPARAPSKARPKPAARSSKSSSGKRKSR